MKSKSKNLQRRWFVNATGWGFNLSLGSGVDQNTGAKVKRSYNATPDSQINHQTSTAAVKHDTLYYFNPLAPITQGTTTSNRLADRIYVENISIRNILSNVGADSGINMKSFRILLIASSTGGVATSWSAGGAIGLANVFRQYGGNNTIALPDPQLCRVLCDETITFGATVASQQTQMVMNVDCTVGEWFEYQPGTAVGIAANLYFILIANEQNATVGTTVLGQIATDIAVVFHN